MNGPSVPPMDHSRKLGVEADAALLRGRAWVVSELLMEAEAAPIYSLCVTESVTCHKDVRNRLTQYANHDSIAVQFETSKCKLLQVQGGRECLVQAATQRTRSAYSPWL